MRRVILCFFCFICMLAGTSFAGTLPVSFEKTDKASVNIRVDGRLFTSFQYGIGFHKPVFFPVYTPMGNMLTRAYPIRFGVEGESQDHWHHESMYFTYGNVNGVDYWAKVGSPRGEFKTPTGKIVFNRFHIIESGKEQGTLAFTADWVQPDGYEVLKQREDLTISAAQDSRTMDYTIRLTAQDQPAVFNDTKEGMFAIRVNPQLNEKHTGEYINAEGLKRMKDVWGKQSPWVALRGTINDEKIVLMIMDHPSNPLHPTRWHARDYGLFTANPFGKGMFVQGADPINYTLQPGETIQFRYRVYIYSGALTKAELDKLYNVYIQTNP
jgi:hypothetical protein